MPPVNFVLELTAASAYLPPRARKTVTTGVTRNTGVTNVSSPRKKIFPMKSYHLVKCMLAVAISAVAATIKGVTNVSPVQNYPTLKSIYASSSVRHHQFPIRFLLR